MNSKRKREIFNMAAASPERTEDLEDTPVLQSWGPNILPDATTVGFELQHSDYHTKRHTTIVPTKEALFKILIQPLLAVKKNAQTELDQVPSGMAPARVREREGLRTTMNIATTAVDSTRKWLKTTVPHNCKITQRWVVVKSVDTHFGSYADLELEVCINLCPKPNVSTIIVLCSEPNVPNMEAPNNSVLVIRTVLGEPLAARTESLGS